MDELRGLWRGKRIDNGEWIHGVPLQHCDGDWQLISGKVGAMVIQTVVADTLGECTGVRDDNGKAIFEGDIVKDFMDQVYEVKFSVDRAGFYPFACGDGCGCCETHTLHLSCGAYVIDNIHDNPGLLEEK